MCRAQLLAKIDNTMILGLRTAIYPAPDLQKAKKWYSGLLGQSPYFDQPFYVGFSVGGFELGLLPEATPSTSGRQPLWGVQNAEAAYARLALGATALEPVTEVGEGPGRCSNRSFRQPVRSDRELPFQHGRCPLTRITHRLTRTRRYIRKVPMPRPRAGDESCAGADLAALVGTWRLVSMVRPDPTARSNPYWDDRASGLIIYTADGHVAAQLYDSRRPRLGIRWESASPEAARTAYVGLITYFGTYLVDRDSATITHNVEAAMTPDWIGSTLVRAYRFLTPDRLELRVVTDGTGRRAANGTIVVWERIGKRPAGQAVNPEQRDPLGKARAG